MTYRFFANMSWAWDTVDRRASAFPIQPNRNAPRLHPFAYARMSLACFGVRGFSGLLRVILSASLAGKVSSSSLSRSRSSLRFIRSSSVSLDTATSRLLGRMSRPIMLDRMNALFRPVRGRQRRCGRHTAPSLFHLSAERCKNNLFDLRGRDGSQSGKGRAQYGIICIGRMHGVDRIQKLRHSRHEVELSGCHVGLDRAHPEVAGPTSRKNIAQCEWTEIYREAGCGFGKAHAMVKHEIRSPIHMARSPCLARHVFRDRWSRARAFLP